MHVFLIKRWQQSVSLGPVGGRFPWQLGLTSESRRCHGDTLSTSFPLLTGACHRVQCSLWMLLFNKVKFVHKKNGFERNKCGFVLWLSSQRHRCTIELDTELLADPIHSGLLRGA